MSKIIYRKVRTAPGLKTTDANWEQSAAYYAKAHHQSRFTLHGGCSNGFARSLPQLLHRTVA